MLAPSPPADSVVGPPGWRPGVAPAPGCDAIILIAATSATYFSNGAGTSKVASSKQRPLPKTLTLQRLGIIPSHSVPNPATPVSIFKTGIATACSGMTTNGNFTFHP